MAFHGLLRQQSRYFPMIFDLIMSVTGTRSWMRSSESGMQIGTQMERKWNANGTQMERIYERIPDAFSVRLFLSSTVYCRRKLYRRLIAKTFWLRFFGVLLITKITFSAVYLLFILKINIGCCGSTGSACPLSIRFFMNAK